jgi:hypothetical protein
MLQPQNLYRPVQDDAHGQAAAAQIISGHACSVSMMIQPRADGADGDWKFDDAWLPEGILNSVGNSGGSTIAIGQLASAFAFELDILEKDGTSHWTASKAFLRHPAQLALLGSRELNAPLVFTILPDSNNKLFSVVPSYIDIA